MKKYFLLALIFVAACTSGPTAPDSQRPWFHTQFAKYCQVQESITACYEERK